MAEITYQMLLSTIQTIALIVGIIYYLTIMRNAQKTRELTLKSQEHATETRQAQLFMQIYDKWSSTEYTEAWHLINNADFKTYDEMSRAARAAKEACPHCNYVGFSPNSRYASLGWWLWQ